jgi:hypothetical protein
MQCITQSSRIKLFSIVGLGIVTVAISADKVLSATLVNPQTDCGKSNSPVATVCYEMILTNNTGKVVNDLHIQVNPSGKFRTIPVAIVGEVKKEGTPKDSSLNKPFNWNKDNFFTLLPDDSVLVRWFSNNNDPKTEYITTVTWTFNGTIVKTTSIPEPTSILSFLALGTLGAASTLKRKLKPSKLTEKETTKVS